MSLPPEALRGRRLLSRLLIADVLAPPGRGPLARLRPLRAPRRPPPAAASPTRSEVGGAERTSETEG